MAQPPIFGLSSEGPYGTLLDALTRPNSSVTDTTAPEERIKIVLWNSRKIEDMPVGKEVPGKIYLSNLGRIILLLGKATKNEEAIDKELKSILQDGETIADKCTARFLDGKIIKLIFKEDWDISFPLSKARIGCLVQKLIACDPQIGGSEIKFWNSSKKNGHFQKMKIEQFIKTHS